MNSLNIVSYVRSWLFLENASCTDAYDAIIYEHMTQEDLLAVPEYCKNKVHVLSHISDKKSVVSHIKKIVDTHPNSILIVEKLRYSDIVWLYDYNKNGVTTVIDTCSGVVGIGQKIHTDDIIPSKIAIYEPISLQDFLIAVHLNNEKKKKSESRYVRIQEYDLPATWWDMTIHDWLISLRWFWYAWDNATILAVGAVGISVLQACDALQQENKWSDVFIQTTRNPSYSKDFIDSLHTTGKCICVIDIISSTELINMLKLWQKNIETTVWKKIQWHVLMPIIQDITTILPEYIYEQAQWDASGLYKRVGEML